MRRFRWTWWLYEAAHLLISQRDKRRVPGLYSAINFRSV